MLGRIRSGWIFIFCLVALAGYLHFIKHKKRSLALLSTRLVEMQQLKQQALEKRSELELRIASQSDPAWIEWILIRDLGVVPEGFLKVHFKK